MLKSTLPFSKASVRWQDGTPVKESYLRVGGGGGHQHRHTTAAGSEQKERSKVRGVPVEVHAQASMRGEEALVQVVQLVVVLHQQLQASLAPAGRAHRLLARKRQPLCLALLGWAEDHKLGGTDLPQLHQLPDLPAVPGAVLPVVLTDEVLSGKTSSRSSRAHPPRERRLQGGPKNSLS